MKNPSIAANIVQISDSHLFADKSAKHFGANVYNNLLNVLLDISSLNEVDAVIFTGDLTQDHTENSYHRFNEALIASKLSCTVYFLAGNHDEIELLERILPEAGCRREKVISFGDWQIALLNSKSNTPAGYFDVEAHQPIFEQLNKSYHKLFFMHHHPINVGYFIDRHHLINGEDFWQEMNNIDGLKGIACGHIHRAMTIPSNQTKNKVPLYTCPATSIQFDPQAETVSALKENAGYRVFSLYDNGDIETEVIYISK